GSTSAQPLLMIVACKIFGLDSEWFHSEEDDTRRLWPTTFNPSATPTADTISQKHFLCNHINNLVNTTGTSGASGGLIRGRVDLIFAARSPSDDELGLAEKLGMKLDARPVALDAFVFLLNVKNPVADLKSEQIRDIYSGRIVNWRAVG